MKVRNIKLAALALSIPLSFAATAEAISIEGGIGINLAPAGTLTYDTTSVDFSDGAGNSQVVTATGDYTALLGMSATYFDFSYDPLMDNNPGDGNPTPFPSPILEGAYIWEIASDPGIHFILTSVTGGVNSQGILALSGSGLAYMNAQGKDITPGSWNFSADNTGAVFNFSSTTNVPPASVPDSGTTFGLLGLAIAVTGIASRRLKK